MTGKTKGSIMGGAMSSGVITPVMLSGGSGEPAVAAVAGAVPEAVPAAGQRADDDPGDRAAGCRRETPGRSGRCLMGVITTPVG